MASTEYQPHEACIEVARQRTIVYKVDIPTEYQLY